MAGQVGYRRADATSEIKFLVTPAVAPRIREWARTYFEADPHGGGRYADEYDISTLYFDTQHLDVFHQRGSYGRAKYRVRRYGNADVVFLERKLRQPGILIKRRTVGSVDALHGSAREGNRPDAIQSEAWAPLPRIPGCSRVEVPSASAGRVQAPR